MSDIDIPSFPMNVVHGSQERVILNIVDGDIPPLSSYVMSTEIWDGAFMSEDTVQREFVGYVPVRQSVTNAALEIALEQLGLLTLVEGLIDQLPPRAPAVIIWRKATRFSRSDALSDFFAPQLNMASTDVDNVFNTAGQIDDLFNNKWG